MLSKLTNVRTMVTVQGHKMTIVIVSAMCRAMMTQSEAE
jgi:hypothetical protein